VDLNGANPSLPLQREETNGVADGHAAAPGGPGHHGSGPSHGEHAVDRQPEQVARGPLVELRGDARIDLRRSGSDWILVRLRRTEDVDRALELLRRAIRATRTIASL